MADPWALVSQAPLQSTPPPAAPPPTAPAPQPTQPTQPSAGGDPWEVVSQQPVAHWYDNAVRELGDLNTGFTTALSQTGLTAQKAIGALPVIGQTFTNATQQARAQDVARAAQPLDTPGKMAGSAIENIIEFAAGDEALKGASTLAQVEKLAPLLSTLKRLPPRLLDITANAIRTGAVGTGQSLLHGSDLPTALESGAVTAGTGAALEGLLSGAGRAAERATEALPTTTEIAGQPITEFQPNQNIITPQTNPEIAATIQPAAKTAYGNIATQTAQRALDRFGETATPVRDFGEATQQLADKASSVYDQIDAASENRFRAINSDVQTAKDDLFNATNRTARADAQARVDDGMKRMNSLIDGFDDANYSQGVREAAQKAKEIFADHYTLDTINRSLNKAFNFVSEATAQGAGEQRTIDGTILRRQLNRLEANPDVGRDRMVQVLGEDGLSNLHKLARVAQIPEQNAAATNIISELTSRMHATGSKVGAATGLLGHFLGAGWGKSLAAGYTVGALAGGGEMAGQKILGYIAQSPRLMNMLSYAAQHSTSARYAGNLLGVAINQELQNDQRTAPEENQ